MNIANENERVHTVCGNVDFFTKYIRSFFFVFNSFFLTRLQSFHRFCLCPFLSELFMFVLFFMFFLIFSLFFSCCCCYSVSSSPSSSEIFVFILNSIGISFSFDSMIDCSFDFYLARFSRATNYV